jgi:hypothetical protein
MTSIDYGDYEKFNLQQDRNKPADGRQWDAGKVVPLQKQNVPTDYQAPEDPDESEGWNKGKDSPTK